MRFTYSIAILVIPILIISSCGKCYNYDCFTPPEPVAMRIMHDSIDLIYTEYYCADSVSITYKSNGGIRAIHTEIYSDSLKEISIIVSDEITWKSVEGIRKYYLHLSEKKTDTIYLNVEPVTNDCCTSHPILEFEVNGIEPKYDISTTSYIITKKIE